MDQQLSKKRHVQPSTSSQMKSPHPVQRTQATAALTAEPLVAIPSVILKAIIKDEPLDQIDVDTSLAVETLAISSQVMDPAHKPPPSSIIAEKASNTCSTVTSTKSTDQLSSQSPDSLTESFVEKSTSISPPKERRHCSTSKSTTSKERIITTSTISIKTPEQTSSQCALPSPEPVKTIMATPPDLNVGWKGVINASEGKVNVQAHEISNGVSDLAELGLPPSLDLIGRIRPEMVWDYINQSRQNESRDVIVFRIAPAADADSSDRQLYSTYLSNLHKSNRFAVVGNISKFIKDFYIIPLPKDSPIPVALTALSHNMKAFDENRTSQLLGVVVRIKRKHPEEESASSEQAKLAKTVVSDSPIKSLSITPPGSSTSSPLLYYIPTICSSEKKAVGAAQPTTTDVADDDKQDLNKDDPSKLLCVCRKPHNNRFMICCDKCKDWFHGTCVGVTRAMGLNLDANGQQWICPNCARLELAPKQKTSQDDVLDSTSKKKRKKKAADIKSAAVNTQDPVVKLTDVVKENAAQHDQKKNRVERASSSVVNSTSGAEPESKRGLEKRKCVLPNCKKQACPNGIYCGDECIVIHARESLLAMSKVASEKQQTGSSPSTPNTPPGKWKKSLQFGELVNQPTPTSAKCKLLKKPANLADTASVPVMERRTGKILMSSNAPKVAQLEQWLKEHPTYEVIKPSTLPPMNRNSSPVVRQNNLATPIRQKLQQDMMNVNLLPKPVDPFEPKTGGKTQCDGVARPKRGNRQPPKHLRDAFQQLEFEAATAIKRSPVASSPKQKESNVSLTNNKSSSISESANKRTYQAEPEIVAIQVSSNNASTSSAQELNRMIEKNIELEKTNEPAQSDQLPAHFFEAEKGIIEVNCPLPLPNTVQSKFGRRKRSEPVTDSSSCSQIPSKKKKLNEAVHKLLEEKNKNMQLLRSRIESMKSIKCTADKELNLVLSRKFEVERRIEKINKRKLETKLELNALKSSSGSDSGAGNGKNQFEVKIKLLEETIKKLERELEILLQEENGLIVEVENAERFLLGASQVLQAIELELVKLDLP